ncbi:DUF6600 domain-containing protein, partial [Sandarakinorhabdus oryzae]|uniref:DUF6600 domain-containing protein n=1 Tax=Sandarakinorhabdus oryzae TaxID=2675220 RepID=UPI0012E29A41
MFRRPALLLLAATLAGCAYPDYAQGVAPQYNAGYQPAGYAGDWPAQPGALWGPEDVPSIEVFREPLSPYGRWLQSPQWGVVFVPNAPQGWRPYERGQWLDNRFWLSDDPWGWATDHYGRWGFDEAIGWVWVPDVTWGPSWVAWREADDVVGWAPIPPRVTWSVGIGFGSGWGYDNWNSWYAPSWVWVPRSNLYSRGFGGRIYPWNTGNNWWGRSRWQNTPYWGWNQPWDRSWGWRAPNRGGYGGQNWNNNRDWRGTQRWNDGRRDNDRWNDPRRGQPGSVGDRIGRDMTGQPPRPGGWNGGWGGNNGGWNRGNGQPQVNTPPGGGWNGGNRPPGGWNGQPGQPPVNTPPGGGWNGGGRPGGWNGQPGQPPASTPPGGGWNGGGRPGGGNG